jgi:hypothetical protein
VRGVAWSAGLVGALVAVGCRPAQPPALPTTRAELVGLWTKEVPARDGRPASDLELLLNADRAGSLAEYPRRAGAPAEMRADLEWWAEERDGRPVLVVRKCPLIAQGAETAIPYRRVGGALRLEPGPAEGAGLQPDLAGDWVITVGHAAGAGRR